MCFVYIDEFLDFKTGIVGWLWWKSGVFTTERKNNGDTESEMRERKKESNMVVQLHRKQKECTIHDTIRQFPNGFSVDRIQWQAIIVNVGENFVFCA